MSSVMYSAKSIYEFLAFLILFVWQFHSVQGTDLYLVDNIEIENYMTDSNKFRGVHMS